MPLLIAQLKEVRIPELLNESFLTHGNWQGLSLEHLVMVWLPFVLVTITAELDGQPIAFTELGWSRTRSRHFLETQIKMGET